MMELTRGGNITARVRRAFRWIFSFRDFTPGTVQTIRGGDMMTDAVTFFTKGRAEFYLDGVRRGDRVPGILSSDYQPVGQDGTFTVVYVEPTTRVCIPRVFNRGLLPTVKKHHALENMVLSVHAGQRLLVCLGDIEVDGRHIKEEQSVEVQVDQEINLKEGTLLLEFLDEPPRR